MKNSIKANNFKVDYFMIRKEYQQIYQKIT